MRGPHSCPYFLTKKGKKGSCASFSFQLFLHCIFIEFQKLYEVNHQLVEVYVTVKSACQYLKSFYNALHSCPYFLTEKGRKGSFASFSFLVTCDY